MAAQMNYYQAMPGGAPPSPVPGVGSPNMSPNFGNLSDQQLSDPSNSADVEGAGRMATMNAIKGGMSTANPYDYAGQDQMRSYLTDYLAKLPQQSQDANSQLDSSSQRGLSNALSQNVNSRAGSGTLGSRQNQAVQSGISANAGQNYMNGLIKNRSDELAKANQVGSGLSSVMGNNLNEREFQANMGKSLAGNINTLTAADAQRQHQLEMMAFDKNAANENTATSAAQTAAMIAMMIA